MRLAISRVCLYAHLNTTTSAGLETGNLKQIVTDSDYNSLTHRDIQVRSLISHKDQAQKRCGRALQRRDTPTERREYRNEISEMKIQTAMYTMLKCFL